MNFNKNTYLQKIYPLFTLCSREFSRILRIWIQTIIPPIITTILYFIVFGNLIGNKIGNIQGFPYIHFIAPGLIMLGIITSSYLNVVSSFFGAKFQRNLDEILITQMPVSHTIIGFIAGGIFRGLLNGTIVLIIVVFFIKITIYNLFIIIATAFLTTVFFSLAGLLNGIFARKFDDTSIFPTFILSPLIYLGGVFYSIDLLPQFWRYVSLFNPILYIINTFRYGFLGVSDLPILHTFLGLFLFIVVLYFLCYWLMNKQEVLYK